MFLILSFSWLEKKKKQFKSQHSPTAKMFTFFQYPPPPLPPPLLVFDIFFNRPPAIPHPPSIRDLRVSAGLH